MAKKITVALAGNPNAGKTTIFNRLTGSRQKVGNWSGVTVEKKEGTARSGDYTIHFVDLPGIYSLTAYSIEEIIARNFILTEKPDVVLNVVDASNLDRNLYLTAQLIELKVKLVLAFTMTDLARENGLAIDTEGLSHLFGTPIVSVVGTKGEGFTELLGAIVSAYEEGPAAEEPTRDVEIRYPKEIEEEIQAIRTILARDRAFASAYPTRWIAVKLLEDDPDVTRLVTEKSTSAADALKSVRIAGSRVTSLFGDDPATIIVDRRYGFIGGAVREAVRREKRDRIDVSNRIDAVLINRILGFPILFFFIWAMFQLTFTLGGYPAHWIKDGVEWLSRFVLTVLPGGFFSALLAEGIIPGVGGVAVFVPNIFILYLIISIFEDTGYMARAAFIMDKVMHSLGLHGKSFIPMIMGFGCNVPAIMATRTLDSRDDRIITILINPLVSCSARLPVYILLAGTFFPSHAGNVIFSVYLLGIVLAFILGRFFRKALFPKKSAPFVMELPPYRLPTLRGTLLHMWEQGSLFLRKMSTVILLGAIVVFLLSHYPATIGTTGGAAPRPAETTYTVAGGDTVSATLPARGGAETKSPLDLSRASYLERIGLAVSPVFAPIGFPWEASVALLSGFVAKEIVVSTFGVLYGAGGKRSIGDAMKGAGWTSAAAYAFMIFVLLYTPCLAAVGAISREASPTFAAFSVGYSLVLAWIVAFAAYRIGLVLGLG